MIFNTADVKGESIEVITGSGADNDTSPLFSVSASRVVLNPLFVDKILYMNGTSVEYDYFCVYFEYDGATKKARYKDRISGTWVETKGADQAGFKCDTDSNLNKLNRWVIVVKQ